MNNIEQLQTKIKQIDLEIFTIKINRNVKYSIMPYNKLQKLQEKKLILKRKKRNLEKNLIRINKLNKLQND